MDRSQAADPDDAPEDPICQRVLSDSAYDTVQVERFSHFKQPVPRKLLIQCALIGALALTLPVYALFPADAATYLPTVDPTTASPTIILMGLFALVIELGAAALLLGVVLYRVRHEPLTEDQAISLFNTETYATYLGFGTGGLATAVMLALFALGLGGESTLGAYVHAMDGANPFRASGLGVTVDVFATVALAGALAVYVARAYAASRLATLE
ncbi:hypothetical protein [Halosimplex salinum]|uniref:hypothetical protein n=1 Tax=Halosimplex salinum TaxID=1710538 RepID=UPI000F47C63E|nr:hypothetical protein [Halosimplex salinum]